MPVNQHVPPFRSSPFRRGIYLRGPGRNGNERPETQIPETESHTGSVLTNGTKRHSEEKAAVKTPGTGEKQRPGCLTLLPDAAHPQIHPRRPFFRYRPAPPSAPFSASFNSRVDHRTYSPPAGFHHRINTTAAANLSRAQPAGPGTGRSGPRHAAAAPW